MEDKIKTLIDNHSIVHNTQGFALFNKVLGICNATKEKEEYLKQAFDSVFKPAQALLEEIEKLKNPPSDNKEQEATEGQIIR